ncbi:MAG: glycosyltransferase 87 family protein [Actinomycetota bacterium]|nr:glycosyltransferase 87 family protein [Actinomycetota bacterium]
MAPTLEDPTAAQASDIFGGPVGRHALIGRAGFFTPLRVILLLAAVFLALGWFAKAPCLQQTGSPSTLDWSNGRQYLAMCYSDTIPLYGAEHLNEGAFPYKSSWVEDPGTPQQQVRHMEYPVATGLYQYASMAVAKAWYSLAQRSLVPGAIEVVLYFNVVALGLALAWLVTVWATALVARRRVWDSALVAMSPLVIVHVFTNFDALATAAAAAGLLAWARKRPLLAGVLLGIGGAAKLYPLLLLGPLLVLSLRSGDLAKGKQSQWVRAAVGGALAWFTVNAPIAALFPAGWKEFFRLNAVRGADPDSIYNVITSFTGWSGFDGSLAQGQAPTALNAVSLALFLAVCAGVAWLGLTARRRPRVAQLCFLLLAGFLLTNKVWSPQYSLWLVPLAVLAVPRTRLLLGWMLLDAFVWVPRMFYYLGVSNKGLPEQYFTGAVVLRDLAVLALCALVVREVWRPGEDLVRAGGFDDDPAGGVLDGAVDAPPSWLPGWLRPTRAIPPHVEAGHVVV